VRSGTRGDDARGSGRAEARRAIVSRLSLVPVAVVGCALTMGRPGSYLAEDFLRTRAAAGHAAGARSWCTKVLRSIYSTLPPSRVQCSGSCCLVVDSLRIVNYEALNALMLMRCCTGFAVA
jgi:hypothetical protein